MIGQKLQVLFVSHGDCVRGRHSSFTKIAFVDRAYAGVQPRAGEHWICEVVNDTKRSDPTHGVYVLKPINIVQSAVQWTIEKPSPGKAGSVVRKVVTGEIVRSSQTWPIFRRSLICAEWPEQIRDEVARLLKALKSARKTRTARSDIVSKQVRASLANGRRKTSPAPSAVVPNRSPQVSEPAREPSKGTLLNPRQVTVVSVSPFEHVLTLESLGDSSSEYELLQDGQPIGVFERDASCVKRTEFPLTVRGVELVLSSDMRPIRIASHTICVVNDRTAPVRSKRGWLQVFRTHCDLTLPRRSSLSWQEASQLQVGALVAVEYPFQRRANQMTNGCVWIPKTYPTKISEWRQLPIARFPEALWDSFLTWLEGKFLGEVVEHHEQVTAPRKYKKAHAAKLTDRQVEINSVIAGQMWQGGEDCERLSLGKNIIFHARRKDGSIVHIVDNPGIGAVYYFEDAELEKAKHFAAGAISRTEARAAGYRLIEHRKGWETQVADLLIQGAAPAA